MILPKIWKNIEGKLQEEYDLFLTNSELIAIIEVKYKAHKDDVKKPPIFVFCAIDAQEEV
jgi:hypothetical protein